MASPWRLGTNEILCIFPLRSSIPFSTGQVRVDHNLVLTVSPGDPGNSRPLLSGFLSLVLFHHDDVGTVRLRRARGASRNGRWMVWLKYLRVPVSGSRP